MHRPRWVTPIAVTVTLLPGVPWHAARAQPDPGANVRTEPRSSPPITQEELNRLIGGPTLLTLHFKDARPQDMLDAIVTQAKAQGVEVRYQSFEQPDHHALGGGPVTVDVEQQPFWAAMAMVLPKLGLQPSAAGDPYRRNGGITLVRAGEGFGGEGRMRGPSVTVGDAVLFANQVERSQQSTVTLGDTAPPARQDNLSVRMSAYVDPKVHLVTQGARVLVESAIDDRGHSLMRAMADGFMGFSSGLSMSLQVPLTAPRDMGAQITRLKGMVRMQVIAKQEEWEVPDILNAKGITKTVGNQVYTIESVVANGDRYALQFKASVPRPLDAAPGAFPSVSSGLRSIRLLDQEGREFAASGSSFRGNGQEYTGDMTFERPLRPIRPRNGDDPAVIGQPTKLVWVIPTEIRTLDIPFTFTDLPIPPLA